MEELLLGCSGWNYGDTSEKGGWVGVFYPDKDTKRLRYYSQFFNTAEMDSIFYERFYSHMTKGTFIGMAKATPDNFQFSIKVPETITHQKRLDVKRGALTDFHEFLDKISPLNNTNKLGAILLQLPPSFTVNDFKNIEGFLDRLPSGYDYAVEFRHPSWKTEGPWDMLKHYNIAAVMTDSPAKETQGFLMQQYYYYIPILAATAIGGSFVGKKMVGKIDQNIFRKIVLVAIILVSINFIINGSRSMLL
jgi:uncharacterized protein YecE (DUF72 family)